MTSVVVVGSDVAADGLSPWNVVEGTAQSLAAPGTVAIDRSYFDRLGVSGVGATAQIRGQPVTVGAVTDGIRSFTTTPYVFSDLRGARVLHRTAGELYQSFSRPAEAGSRYRSGPARIFFRAFPASRRSLRISSESKAGRSGFSGTGAGAALVAGALLGVIVGTVIVAQTLYSSTKDHLYEFATLARDGRLQQLYLQSHYLSGAAQRHHRICHCGVDRSRHRPFHREKRTAGRDHAQFDNRAVRSSLSSCASSRRLRRFFASFASILRSC